jgi:hypothetical protein
MRRILLITIALLTTGSVFAQYVPEYRAEIGINTGLATTSLPSNTEYSGKKASWNNYTSLRCSYAISDYYQLVFEAGVTQWMTRDKWSIDGVDNNNIGLKEVKYVFGKPALSFLVHANRIVPFYSRYREMVRSQFNVGVCGGLAMTVVDGNNVNGYSTPDSMTYVKEFHYEAGRGIVIGAQIGYTYYVKRHFGINIEGSARYCNMVTQDRRYGGLNKNYDLVCFPVTLGVRYRW